MQNSRQNSEKVIERTLTKKVSNLGGLCLKFISSFCIGMPDRLVLLPGGRAFFVELKSTGQKARKIQLVRHETLRNLGFEVYIIDNLEDIDLILEKYGQV